MALNGTSGDDRFRGTIFADEIFGFGGNDIVDGSPGAADRGTSRGDQFVIGAAAQDADDRIVYDDTTGALLFDVDGTGAAAPVQFADIGAGLALTNLDFLV